jgi:hypothetical protein
MVAACDGTETKLMTMPLQRKHSSRTYPVWPFFNRAPHGLLERKYAYGNNLPVRGDCEECKKNSLGLQKKAADRVSKVSRIVHDVLRSPGQPLDAASAFFEPRFGHDFSQVQVHSDAKAAESARAVNALAYSVDMM